MLICEDDDRQSADCQEIYTSCANSSQDQGPFSVNSDLGLPAQTLYSLRISRCYYAESTKHLNYSCTKMALAPTDPGRCAPNAVLGCWQRIFLFQTPHEIRNALLKISNPIAPYASRIPTLAPQHATDFALFGALHSLTRGRFPHQDYRNRLPSHSGPNCFPTLKSPESINEM